MSSLLNIEYPEKLNLANIPTPLEKLRRLGRKLDLDLYIKRDDLTGSELSGNKIRKLEFILAHALSQGADTVLTCGGAQSNHARATAVAAVRAGLKSLLILRTPDPSNPPPATANILLDRLVGAEIVWITPEEYKSRGEIFEREAERLRKEGRNPFILPEGGSTALGAWGYIRAMEELAHDLALLEGGTDQPATVIAATGSGGTLAGIILGAKLLGLNIRPIGINVCDDREYFVNEIGRICAEFKERYAPQLVIDPQFDIEIIDGYVGRGYALSAPEELELIREIAQVEGVFLDPVYTGKAFNGFMKELEKYPKFFGQRVVFVHTGGIYGLFPKEDQFAELF